MWDKNNKSPEYDKNSESEKIGKEIKKKNCGRVLLRIKYLNIVTYFYSKSLCLILFVLEWNWLV